MTSFQSPLECLVIGHGASSLSSARSCPIVLAIPHLVTVVVAVVSARCGLIVSDSLSAHRLDTVILRQSSSVCLHTNDAERLRILQCTMSTNSASPAPASTSTSAAHQNVVPSEVGWQFVPQYYTFVNKQPNRLHCFYTKNSTFIHGTEGEDGRPCYGQQVCPNQECCL